MSDQPTNPLSTLSQKELSSPEVQKILDDHSEALMPVVTSDESVETVLENTPSWQYIGKKLTLAKMRLTRLNSGFLKQKKAKRKAGKIARQSRRYNLRHSS